ncbi:ribonuclease H-like domain-containing protein [Tanacetum coccineum]
MLVPPVVVGEGSEQPSKSQPTPFTAPPEVLSLVTTATTSQPSKDPSTYRRTKKGRNTKVPQSGGSPNKVGDEAINEEMLDSVKRATTTATSLEAEQASGNIHKTQFKATLNEPFSLELGSGSGLWRQETIGGMQAQTRFEDVSNLSSDPPLAGGHTLGSGEDNMEHQIELTYNVPNTPHDSPLPGVNTPGSDEGRLKLKELMAMCTKLSKQTRSQASYTQKKRIYRQVESSDDDLDKEDTSNQGRTSDKTKPMFKDRNFDDIDDLVDEGMVFIQEKDAENHGKIGTGDTEVVKGSGDTEVLDTEKAVNTAGEGVSTASVPEIVSNVAPRTPLTTTTVFDDKDVTMAMAQTLIKIKEEKAKKKGVAIKDVEYSSRPIWSITTLQPLLTIDLKDKGKGILQETEPVEKTKKNVQGDAHIERDAEVALRLQAELDEELRVERERQEEASKVAIAKMFDVVQARMDADYELAARMTHGEQEKYTIKERVRLLAEFFERRKKHLAAERAEAIRNKPPTKIQQQKRIQDFTPIGSEKEAQKPGKRLKRVAGSYTTQKSTKKPKVMKSAKDITEEEAAEYEKEKEELRLSLKIISNDDSEVNYEPLSRKFPFMNWEYQLLGKIEAKDMYVYKLTRVDGSSSYHGDTQAFLRRLDRQDLNDLYRLSLVYGAEDEAAIAIGFHDFIADALRGMDFIRNIIWRSKKRMVMEPLSLYRRALRAALNEVHAAIVTYGGLCPGLNTVIRDVLYSELCGRNVLAKRSLDVPPAVISSNFGAVEQLDLEVFEKYSNMCRKNIVTRFSTPFVNVVRTANVTNSQTIFSEPLRLNVSEEVAPSHDRTHLNVAAEEISSVNEESYSSGQPEVPTTVSVVHRTCSIHKVEIEDVTKSVLPVAASHGYYLKNHFVDGPVVVSRLLKDVSLATLLVIAKSVKNRWGQ